MHRRPLVVVAPVLVALALSACGPEVIHAGPPAAAGATSASVTTTPAAATTTPPIPVTVSASVADGATLPAGKRVTLLASGGVIKRVSLTAADGTVVDNADDVARYSTPADLRPLSPYIVTATTVDSAGTEATFTHSFTTGAPLAELRADVYPYGDAVVGIATPIIVILNHPVIGSARADVERAMMVESDIPYGDGSWAWLSSTEVHFRPAEFWPAYAHVTVHIAFDGLHPAIGLWGVKSRDVTFQTGRALVLNVNDSTHLMTVTVDGHVLRTIGVSMGKPGFESRSGIKVISAKTPTYRMQSATIGVTDKKDPNFYDTVVQYAMRITNSGEFIHAAPWNKFIGKEDRSHGCTNISTADAIWLYDRVMVGDPVIATGTVKKMEGWNGLGAEWNYSFGFWKSLSAL